MSLVFLLNCSYKKVYSIVRKIVLKTGHLLDRKKISLSMANQQEFLILPIRWEMNILTRSISDRYNV